MSTVSSPQSNAPKCRWCMRNDGVFRCTKCRDTIPPAVYCGPACQKSDWSFHKKYCGKYSYTFDLTLIGSSNPTIKRTFDVPSWFTFRQLHYTIQYIMGPWQLTHLHDFTMFRPSSSGDDFGSLAMRDDVLRIIQRQYSEDEWDRPQRAPVEFEETLKLMDVFGEGGRLNDLATDQTTGKVYPLLYLYDFGDNWEHHLVFRGQKLASAARPLVSSATGCGPVEDVGGIYGWNELKKAFRATSPTAEQREKREWAGDASGLGDKFDPFQEPNVVQMNYEGRWENHLEDFMLCSGERLPRLPISDDDDVF